MCSDNYTCSECGQEFYVSCSLRDYAYKSGYCQVQCSYTCYDHAKLRNESGKFEDHRYKEFVFKSEERMRSQGKTVLNPIKLE